MYPNKLLFLASALANFVSTNPLLPNTDTSLTENLINANDVYKDVIQRGVDKLRSVFPGKALYSATLRTDIDERPSSSYLDFKYIFLIFFDDPAPAVGHPYVIASYNWGQWNNPSVSSKASKPRTFGNKVIDLSTIRMPVEDADRIIKNAGYTWPYRTISLSGWPDLTDQLVWKFRMVDRDSFFSVGVGIEDGKVYKRAETVEDRLEDELLKDLTTGPS